MSDSTPSSNVLQALIIGAGISGLSLAHHLEKQQLSSLLVCEAQDRVGGNITSRESEGFSWEEGPNSFQPGPELLRLTVDLGLQSDLLLADPRLPRFVYWQNILHPVPMSPPDAIKTQLLSDAGKLRAFLGAVGFVSPALGQSIAEQGGEETVRQFFQRHLGVEVTERLVAPFVSGVYAGDVDALSASAAFGRVTNLEEVGGGLVAGALLSRRKNPKPPVDPDLPKTRPGELGSFKDGLKQLPEAIANRLGDRVKLKWKLVAIRPTERNTYLCEMETPEGHQTIETRSLVLTTPAYITSELLAELAPVGSPALAEIPYPPVASVVIAYPKSALKQPLIGFGNLIPRGQGIRTLGTIWTSSLFPGKAPEDWQLFNNFIGGATYPELGDLTEAEIVQQVHEDLGGILLKPDAPQPKVLAVHLWKRAIPQYTLGHKQRLASLDRDLSQLPGMFVCTNYTDGVALGDCVKRSQQHATDILNYLQAL
ncbi:protoporphyrinogen oxidase [Roseofilum casamattae]|uniref:Coproporphyrinogen III oxidase n=1 Tax=Roseofilum casamattae BLCC-M143 TaxID=3022442 RepID=A0ABT7BYR8_9CYAN|nr:protoporphyrinogen oxidase [Roseofilum casamattae]MDJ1184330.1 protoporphyrinogen oxidase [Roseofilum casamattae BLCC-M143]